jgi:PAS domain S-box-containing protein
MKLSWHQDPSNVFYQCVESSNDAMMMTNPQGYLQYVNPAWCTIYGYDRHEVLGRNPRFLQSGHQDSAFYDKMWQAILDPEVGGWRGELINRTKHGDTIPVLLTITPIRNVEGELQGYLGIAVDISKQKELQLRLLQQDRLASIGLLAGGLIHQLGTPLTVARGRAMILARKMGGACPGP